MPRALATTRRSAIGSNESEFDNHPINKVRRASPSHSNASSCDDAPTTSTGGITLQTLNSFLICPLCNGYLINAHTLTECSHAFCKSCLFDYSRKLARNDQPLTCPICGTTQQLFHTKPEHGVRPDRLLQSLVYKLVPGLINAEVGRRREYTSEVLNSTENGIKNEQKTIDLSLEYLDRFICNTASASTKRSNSPIASESTTDDRSASPAFPRIYLRLPTALTILQLKKFISCRFELGCAVEINLLSENEELLHESLSLTDVAFLLGFYHKQIPLRLFFTATASKGRNSEKRLKSSELSTTRQSASSRSIRHRKRLSAKATPPPVKEEPLDSDGSCESAGSVECARHEPVLPELTSTPSRAQSSSPPLPPREPERSSTPHPVPYLTSIADPVRPRLLLRRITTEQPEKQSEKLEKSEEFDEIELEEKSKEEPKEEPKEEQEALEKKDDDDNDNMLPEESRS